MCDAFCYQERNDTAVEPWMLRVCVTKQSGTQVLQKLGNDHFIHRSCCPLQSQVNEFWRLGQRIEANKKFCFRALSQ